MHFWSYDHRGLLTVYDGDEVLLEVKTATDLNLHDGMIHCTDAKGNPVSVHIGNAQPGHKYELGGTTVIKPPKSEPPKPKHEVLTADGLKTK